MSTTTTSDDDQSGMMGWWIGEALDSPFFLKTRMAFAVIVGLAATLLFTYIILQMERQTTTYNAAAMEAAVGERDTQLELEEDTQSTMTNGTSHQSNSDYVQATENQNDDEMSIHSSTTAKTRSASPKSVIAAISSKAVDGLFKPGDTRRRLLSRSQHVQVIVHVAIVILFIYLLLVYLPGSIWLSFLAVMIVWVLALQSYLRDEIKRRQRIDRITTLLGLFSIIAGSLALTTYCHMSLKEGDIYEGPARIVGYDDTAYSNKDGNTMRADLVVSWGGMWGCPDLGGLQCTATVQGALCETEYDTDSDISEGNYRSRRRHQRSRRVKQTTVVEAVDEYRREEQEMVTEGINETVVEEDETEEDDGLVVELEDEVEIEGEEIEEEDEEVDELNEELTTETEIHIEGEDALETEVTVLESNSTDPDKEEELTDLALGEAYEAGNADGQVETLEEQNEKLQSELDAAEETIGVLVDEEMSEITYYDYDDTVYEDSYWQEGDWDSVWGEYACEDLFDSDTSDQSQLDMSVAPGADHWPTVNIYGSCNSCQAYIFDYYSTEHYQNILQYESQAHLYYLVGLFFMIAAAIMACFERKRPKKENKMVLLSQERGVAA